jgi:hypothetical protein
MNRQRAFLSNSEWVDFNWKTEVNHSQHPLNSMLDIALKILPEIVNQDMPKKWKISGLKERLAKAWIVVEELDKWERELQSRYHGLLCNKVLSSWGGLYEYRFEFPGTSTATAFAMYTAVRIHVADLIATISEELLSRIPTANVQPSSAVLESLRWARLACQSLEYFHTGVPKVAGRTMTLWPLETAWELFSRLKLQGVEDLSQEIAWCRSTAERHAARGIPPFRWR